jgi:hypothetical protein
VSTRCRFEGCREKKGLRPCWSCSERACRAHLANSDYAAFVGTIVPRNFPGGRGCCATCVLSRCPEHMKGVIDKKCSWVGCTASLSSLLILKRLCSYCGRWFCHSHFMTDRDMHTMLSKDLEPARRTRGEGACAECLQRSEEGKHYAGRRGWLTRLGANVAEGAVQELRAKSEEVGKIARQAAQQAVEGGVAGLHERKEQIVQITAEALNAPVRQRVMATIVGLVGAQVALLASMIYGASQKDWAFYRTYRWIALGLIVAFLVLSFLAVYVRGRRLWMEFEKAGAVGTAGRELALRALLRALVMNLPLLVLAVVLALVGGVLLLTLD